MMEKPKRKKFRQETVIHSFIVRPLAQEVVLFLWNTNVTANQITFFRVFLNAIAIAAFFYGTTLSVIIGLFLFWAHEIIDHADGEYARRKNQCSRVGQFYEMFFDNVLSTSFGLLGFSIAFSASSFTGESIYIYLFIFTAITANIYYLLASEVSKSEGKTSFESIDHDNEKMLALWGVSIKEATFNLIKTIKQWHNQLLLISLAILFISDNQIPILISSLFVSTLYFLHSARMAIVGYKVAICLDKGKE